VNVAPKETTMSFDVLYFEVRGRRCALPISEVREVMATPPITPVPSAPAALRGLVPVHGQVLPLVDVGPQLGAGSDSAGSSPARWDGDRIIVVETSVANVVPGTSGGLDGESFQARAQVRAAMVANKVTRLGTVDEGHSRPPPPGPPFIRAMVLDLEGPALLLDPGRALESLRASLLGLGAA
jgi:chemotaxis signal transduction protein